MNFELNALIDFKFIDFIACIMRLPVYLIGENAMYIIYSAPAVMKDVWEIWLKTYKNENSSIRWMLWYRNRELTARIKTNDNEAFCRIAIKTQICIVYHSCGNNEIKNWETRLFAS